MAIKNKLLFLLLLLAQVCPAVTSIIDYADYKATGATTTRMTPGGFDRNSAGAEIWNMQNSGAGLLTVQVDGQTVWHAGNDGAGSGLDADLVRGAYPIPISGLASSTIGFTDGAGIGGSGSPTSLGGTYVVSSTTATPQFGGMGLGAAASTSGVMLASKTWTTPGGNVFGVAAINNVTLTVNTNIVNSGFSANAGSNQAGFTHGGTVAVRGLNATASATGATGTVGQATACIGTVSNTGAGTLTAAAAFYANTGANSGSGTLGTNFGFYCATQTAGATNYQFYGAGTQDSKTLGAWDSASYKVATTEVISAARVATFTQENTDNLRLDANTVSSTDTNGNVNITPNGTGKVRVVTNPLELGDDADSYLEINKRTTTPTATPASSAECQIYLKNNFLVIRYNDAGTARFKYLDLSGVGFAWAYSATTP